MVQHLRLALALLALLITPITLQAETTSDNADLLKMIQISLTNIGYQPGNTDGNLDNLTIVAISQFQATRGIEVTGQASPQLAGILQAEVATAPKPAVASESSAELAADYLSGFWCTERAQERELYSFSADGSYRLGVVGITITQMSGVNYFPETYSRQSFFDKFESVVSQDGDRFSVTMKNGAQKTFLRGNCFE